MTINPIGNNLYPFIPAVPGSVTGKVAAASQPARPELFPEPCQTCASRRYVDQSNDSSVSFQTPTKLAPSEAALAVAAHENEHVVHNRENAQEKGMTAHSTVTISYGICPECGRIYVAGGKTTTTFTPKQQAQDTSRTGLGGNIDTLA